MKYSDAKNGRVFILRLENDEIIHEVIEQFAEEHVINSATVMALGAVNQGSKVVVGPVDHEERPVTPRVMILEHVYEAAGTGTIFKDQSGKPILHMHMAMGRHDSTIVGCIRHGVKVWNLLEVVIYELTSTDTFRKFDNNFGFNVLEPTTQII